MRCEALRALSFRKGDLQRGHCLPGRRRPEPAKIAMSASAAAAAASSSSSSSSSSAGASASASSSSLSALSSTPPLLGTLGYVPLTTEQAQVTLDENHCLIDAITEAMRKGDHKAVLVLQQRLQHNLVLLATIAEVETPESITAANAILRQQPQQPAQPPAKPQPPS